MPRPLPPSAADRGSAPAEGSEPAAGPAPPSVFISYSHKDTKFLEEFCAHLKSYSRTLKFSPWSDRQIRPGDKWMHEIQAALAASKFAVLLVSKDFLASDFVHEHELGPILRGAELGGVRGLWLLIRVCSWKETPLNYYQALLNPEKPLAEMKAERDRAWVRACDALKEAVLSSDSTGREVTTQTVILSSGPALEVVVRLSGMGELTLRENMFAGTSGQARPMEGFRLRLTPPRDDLHLRYMAHLAGLGDTDWVGEGEHLGTPSSAVEGFAIQLTGPESQAYNVEYMAHLAGTGDTKVFRDGEFCGTRGEARSVEGMMVRITRKPRTVTFA